MISSYSGSAFQPQPWELAGAASLARAMRQREWFRKLMFYIFQQHMGCQINERNNLQAQNLSRIRIPLCWFPRGNWFFFFQTFVLHAKSPGISKVFAGPAPVGFTDDPGGCVIGRKLLWRNSGEVPS